MMRALLFLLIATPLFAADAIQYTVLAADRGKGRIAIVNGNGEVEWQYDTKHDVHDIHKLDNGNILTHLSHTKIVEITPSKEIAWSYEAKPTVGNKGKVEVHAFQRLSDGSTMIAESGNSRIIEVNSKGEIVKEIPLKVVKSDSHRDTRMVRKLKSNHYLVCHEGEGCVREYDDAGKVVWEYKLDLNNRPRSNGHGPEGHGVEVFGAVRLDNGNTLIAGGNNNRVFEVSPKGEIVWQVDQKDLPGITLAWVTTIQVLPNGHIVVGNCHAGPTQPQLVEINRDKKVIWTFNDHKNFGNDLAASQILNVNGRVIR
jgi:hypothetical protein